LKEGFHPGVFHEFSRIVSRDMCIEFLGEKFTPVYSTPAMIWDMEEAARVALHPYLEEGEESVGTVIHVQHLAATPLGMKVTLRAKLLELNGRRCVFEVEAFDEKEKIGEGSIERFVINIARFAERAQAKLP
jgi:predicted thioesterase